MIYAIGEALIDMFPSKPNSSLKDSECFVKQAGGAPYNTAAAVAALGGKSAFIGKVGADGFGRYLESELSRLNVDTSRMFFSSDKFTGIIYIARKESGEREFCAMRSDSADLYLSEDEIDPEWFTSQDILHFCSVSLIEAPVRYAHIKALDSIIRAGGRVCFDVNLRPMLWKNKDDLIKAVMDFMKYPDYLKISDTELYEIFNHSDIDKAIPELYSLGKRLTVIIVTAGAEGSYLFFKNANKYYIPPYRTEAVDTTGAGDCYIGAFLYRIALNDTILKEADYVDILDFASAAASLSVRKLGAINSLPSLVEVESLIKEKNRG